LIQKPADEVVRELHQPETLRAAESPFPSAEPNYPFQIAMAGGRFFQDQATLRVRREPTYAIIEQNIRASQFMGRKSHKPPLTLVSEPASIAAEPPATLREAGRNLWQSVMREYAIADAGGLALLEQACASADRAAECAAIIAEQGAVISTKYGLKDHPLLRHEATARGLVGRLLARLGLDVEPLRPAAGRPGVGFGWVPPR
jgi:hypothetical protein